MTGPLIEIITSLDPAVRNQAIDRWCRSASLEELLRECVQLDRFRRDCANLYERVRALFFLYSIHRFHLPAKAELKARGWIPFAGYAHLLERRFEEAIETFLTVQAQGGPNEGLCSALAEAYHKLAFQTLANQVQRSVRSVRGNQWMFRMGHPADHPLRLRPEMLARPSAQSPFPILQERTPVRMDLSHSAWSDIFFLGMDFPEGARVLNISVDLSVVGKDASPRPPVEVFLRVIDEPLLRLTSLDLGATADISQLAEVFDFARDYLGLLKAAMIASGLVPPGVEGSGQSLADLLGRIVQPGYGLEIVSNVHGIPKGSRLAVSTTLLASLIAVCMRATGQTERLTGPLLEQERRLVAARAILGEWLGGSGGGWQDSGGVWPGIKIIQGKLAQTEDQEFGVSRGCLLPSHHILDHREAPPQFRQKLQDSLILVHGGMAQNVGPILEMVTEKYLLRSEKEWLARQEAIALMEEVLSAMGAADVQALGAVTHRNFHGPIQTIIPWASNLYTETLISRIRHKYGDEFLGFWMLGGMSGGGMGFMFAPEAKPSALNTLYEIMLQTKREMETALPFAMNPVVYDFAINETGTTAEFLRESASIMPPAYYAFMAPKWLRMDSGRLSRLRRLELERYGSLCRTLPEYQGSVSALIDRLLPQLKTESSASGTLAELLARFGFDRAYHEQIRSDLRNGRIGLAQNRLPASTQIKDVTGDQIVDAMSGVSPELEDLGWEALKAGEVGVVTLAAGAGSRWTQGAGVVKALHPFCKLGGLHRSFLETHLAKSRRISRLCAYPLPHLVTTSHLTHDPIEQYLLKNNNFGYPGPVLLSSGRAVGLRLIPMVRDLRFAWEEMPQQLLDEQAQKVRESLHAALVEWAQRAGEGADYTDNLPLQCLHPVGHWYEIPNLLKNGVLSQLLKQRPQLKYLMLHNVDTVGADPHPRYLGLHIKQQAALSFELITRRVEDRGGGLACVNGRVRLVEGLAMPREEDEFALSYYNSMTTWISLDRLLEIFGLTRQDLDKEETVSAAIRRLSLRIPTYVTLKDVKKRWGHGQEDIYPVAQFEKLWSDMTALPEIACSYLVVPRPRGQQLKDQSQLDGWVRDGSADYVSDLCDWT